MDGLKQRIIGALVLIALAVIFVPMIFDEPHSGRTSTSINIPEEPPFPEVKTPPPPPTAMPEYRPSNSVGQNAPEPDTAGQESDSSVPEFQLIEGVSPQKPMAKPAVSKSTVSEPAAKAAASAVAKPDAAQSNSTADAKPQGAEELNRSLEGAWVVQLGSFGNADNARRLRDNAREKGYSSHLEEFSRGDTRLTRVFSGPFASKSEAETAKTALDKAFNLNTLVTSGDK